MIGLASLAVHSLPSMLFTAPWFLLALIPWSLVALRVARGSNRAAGVTGLFLWPRSTSASTSAGSWRLPDWPTILAMLACLLGLLAAAGPVVLTERATRIVIVNDDWRYPGVRSLYQPVDDALWKAYLPQLEAHFGSIDLRREPQSELPVADVVASLHRNRPGDVIVAWSMKQTPAVSAPAVSLPRTFPIQNLGISKMALDASGTQLMIEVRSNFPTWGLVHLASSTLAPTRHEVDLTLARTARIFIDLPSPGAAISAHLEEIDDYTADNTATLSTVRARLRLNDAPSKGLQTFADAYSRFRPPGTDATDLIVGNPGESIGLWISSKSGGEMAEPLRWDVPYHPAMPVMPLPEHALIQWANLPAGEWRVILSAGDKPMMAVRESPRQVWIGPWIEAYEAETVFPVFLMTAIDWLLQRDPAATQPGEVSGPYVDFAPPASLSQLSLPPRDPSADVPIRKGLLKLTIAVLGLAALLRLWQSFPRSHVRQTRNP